MVNFEFSIYTHTHTHTRYPYPYPRKQPYPYLLPVPIPAKIPVAVPVTRGYTRKFSILNVAGMVAGNRYGYGEVYPWVRVAGTGMGTYPRVYPYTRTHRARGYPTLTPTLENSNCCTTVAKGSSHRMRLCNPLTSHPTS